MKHQLIAPPNMKLIYVIEINYFLRNNQCVSIYPCFFPGCSSGSNYTTKHAVKSDITKLTSYSKQYIIGGDLKYLHNLWGCETVNCCIKLIYEAVDADRNVSYKVDLMYLRIQLQQLMV